MQKNKKGEHMKFLGTISSLLLVIGGIHLGLVGILDVDVINMVFGGFGTLPKIVYGLIGLSAINHIIQGHLFDFS
jgi:uncharacterized membrane protein YuzA (DUF378 family)